MGIRELLRVHLAEEERRLGKAALSDLEVLIMLILGASDKPLSGTRVQKLVFLAAHELGLIKEVDFEPHHFGPYSDDVVAAEEELIKRGLITIIQKKRALTRTGLKLYDILKERYEELAKVVDRVINDTKSLSDRELVAYVYFLYPKYTTASKILDEVLRNKVRYLIELYRKGAISLEFAARASGLGLRKFMELLRSYGIRPPLSD